MGKEKEMKIRRTAKEEKEMQERKRGCWKEERILMRLYFNDHKHGIKVLNRLFVSDLLLATFSFRPPVYERVKNFDGEERGQLRELHGGLEVSEYVRGLQLRRGGSSGSCMEDWR